MSIAHYAVFGAHHDTFTPLYLVPNYKYNRLFVDKHLGCIDKILINCFCDILLIISLSVAFGTNAPNDPNG
ncbi:MAG: hypothetical protein MI674_01530 [Cytophagales bacterium]|nr:hypothetical protein [Cytophagales bacterium]